MIALRRARPCGERQCKSLYSAVAHTHAKKTPVALCWARNNFGVIFSFVYISRSCRLRWPERLYLKFYFSQAFKFAELKLQI